MGAAIAVNRGITKASKAAEVLGKGLQVFCIPGSVADQRDDGISHGQLVSRLLSEKSNCFCFLAGHESFAAAEGAIKIAQNANTVRTNP
jgi:hypothetical protein